MRLTGIAPQIVLDGLFATVTYRLEPEGRGSRFPVVMKRLFAGRLDAADVAEAARELAEIESGLEALPPERVVWSVSDLRRRDDSGLPVNRSATNVRDYFVTADGRPLVTALREALRPGEPVKLSTGKARQMRGGAWGAIALGVVWAVVGYLFFPNWIFTNSYGTSTDTGGPLLWPAGIFFAGAGAVQLLLLRFQAVEEWFEDRVWFSVVLILVVTGAYFALAWRS